RLTIALIGGVAGGKSSCVNTVASFLSGSDENLANTGKAYESLTTDFGAWYCMSPEGEACTWRMLDTPGDFFQVGSQPIAA
ncbi:hypothetical protein, partial [Citrobacter freundii]|uniref:hypothetical protein n=1 Tax=Citrobacter freundii TaxID=546 RepID=UPI002000D352